MGAPFVGRTGELADLQALAPRALNEHRPYARLIAAPAGYGKSRLLAEVREHISPAARLEVTGFETERVVPLASAVGLLRSLAPHDSLLGEVLGGADPVTSGPLDALRIFEAAHRATRAIRPCVLLVDDLQWLDDVSLGLCNYLVRGAFAAHLPLVTIACTRPSSQASGFSESLAKLLGPDAFAVVDLPGLDRAEGARLASAIRPELVPEQAEGVWEAAEGSPFWIERLAPSAADPGSNAATASTHLLGRLEAAGTDATIVLTALAVAGRPMGIDELGRVLGWDLPRVAEACGRLAARALAVDDPSGLRPGHELIRLAALESSDDATRNWMHGRLSKEMERGAGADLRMLRGALEHRRAAGMPTAQLALRVATSEQRRLLGADGLAELAAVADSGAATVDLDRALANLATELGEHRVALDRWLRVRDVEVGQRGEATIAAAREAYRLGDGARARRLIAEGRADAPDPGQEVALAALEASVVMWLDHRILDGAALAWPALAAAEHRATTAGGAGRLGDEDRRGYRDALLAAFDAAIQTSQPERLGSIARGLAATAGADERARLEANVLEGVAERLAGDVVASERHFRRAWNDGRRRVIPSLAASAGYWLAQTLHDTGRLDEAVAVTDELRDLITRVGPLLEVRPTGRVRGVVHEIAVSRGPWRAAIADLAADAEREAEAHYRIGLYQLLAVSLARIDPGHSAELVLSWVEAARTDMAATGCPRCGAELDLFSAEALARIGQVDEARQLASSVAATRPPDSRTALHRARLHALLSDEPGVAMRGVTVEADRLGLLLDAAWARVDVARLLEQTDRLAVASAYREAGRFAAERGAGTQQGLAEAGLRALGVRTWRRGAAGTSALSSRELDVARLAAAGLSNPEIADQLFLSRKTVERHISNALAKLGARNRTELATRIDPTRNEGAPR